MRLLLSWGAFITVVKNTGQKRKRLVHAKILPKLGIIETFVPHGWKKNKRNI